MPNSKWARSRRDALFAAQGGRCHWCKCEMIPPPQIRPLGASQAPNEATLDHLYPRGEPGRYVDKPNKYVAACYACNNLRGNTPVAMWVVCFRHTGAERLGDSHG